MEVSDNGSGIDPSNFAGLALKHWTSKLSSFDDLDSLHSFGFRGEAISSLCALSELSVVTRTAGQPAGSLLEYDYNGVLVKQSAAAREIGTTVRLRNLFSTVPVRHKEFVRNARREYARLLTLLESYALISTGLKLTVTHQGGLGSGARQVVLQTAGNSDLRDNVANVFGAKQAASLIPVQAELGRETSVSGQLIC